ncbi:tubby C-terminal-like domain-containing protein [Naematelia encephala]|uniref:Tubby C-terminal-like domain-containing protein n=1 Tax=Naematelia encephala TaxID=71784 RepID=A0A1Y2BBQ5_9TREE|nr:tubby C-terminal-like domain-containing protein [Naematelia encephala]
MGLFTSSAPMQLAPIHPPLGMHPQYCVNVPTTLVLKEKAFSFSGDDFAVKDSNGIPVVHCKGKAFSFRDRKVITDNNGNLLFHLRNKMIAIHKTFIAEDEQERELFRVKKRLAIGTKMEATFVNQSTGQPVTLELRGDMWGGSADLSMGGMPVAQISRKLFNARELFVDKQTYFVTVAPGVDLALIAAICICFDEAKNENDK